MHKALHFPRCARRQLAGALALAASTSTYATVETYVSAVGGQANIATPGCGFAGLPIGHTRLFGGSSGVFLPVPGEAACGLAGTHRSSTASNSLLDDSMAVNTTFHGASAGSISHFEGHASANAGAGQLGARADAVFSGDTNGLTYKGAEGYGLITDTLTFTHASHAAGTVGRFDFGMLLEGRLSTTTTNTYSVADFNLSSSIDGNLGVVLAHAQLNNSDTPAFVYVDGAGSGNNTAGFVSTPGHLDVLTSLRSRTFEFVWGQPFELTIGLQAIAIGAAPGSVVIADFLNTATFEGFHLFDTAGNEVEGFSVAGASGDLLSAVPEAPTGPLAGLGLLLLVAARPRRADRSR